MISGFLAEEGRSPAPRCARPGGCAAIAQVRRERPSLWNRSQRLVRPCMAPRSMIAALAAADPSWAALVLGPI
jgi:hypothetical protein